MKRVSLTMLIALLGLGLPITGCDLITGSDEEDAEGSLPAAPSELNLAFGGYEPTDEYVGFGDAIILAQFTQDAEEDANDAIANDVEVRAMEDHPETDVYFLRITWGHLEREGSAYLDWSGSASVVGGAIVVRRTILFEPGDFIHRPREDRRTLEWTSNTYTHLDGLALVIFDPPSQLTGETVVNQLTFETGPFSQTFTMEELASVDTLITVDDDGNAIHFTGKKRETGLCRVGFMRGQWYSRGLDWGEFRGGWIDEEGYLSGHLRGIWGYDADGRNVLYGKYIDTEGNFKGLLRGTFGTDPAHRAIAARGAAGWFRGCWVDENHEVRGVFRGRWKEPTARDRNGYFQGVWGVDCPDLEDEVPEL